MTIKRKLACLIVPLALTVVAAAPVLADDVELLLTSAQSNDVPNVNFILDTSGSMNTLEQTVAFYNSAIVYPGTCNVDSFYWSDTGVPPACTDRREVVKASFVCAAAAGQVAALGSYTGVLAQHRDKGPKWQDLKDRKSTSTVECAADSGIHGNGTAGEVYAQRGKNKAEFTNAPGLEIDWESFPTNLSYTMYTGNYLNWRENPPAEDIPRIDIVKSIQPGGSVQQARFDYRHWQYATLRNTVRSRTILAGAAGALWDNQDGSGCPAHTDPGDLPSTFGARGRLFPQLQCPVNRLTAQERRRRPDSCADLAGVGGHVGQNHLR